MHDSAGICRRTVQFCASLALALTLLVVVWAQPSQAPAPPPTEPSDVIDHLERTIDWYHEVVSAEQEGDLADDVVARARVHQSATEALQLAFEYARAQAVLLHQSGTTESEQAAPRPASNFAQIQARLAQRVSNLQSRLTDVNTALPRATATARRTLLAERDALAAQLDLVNTIQSSVGEIVRFATSSQAAESAGDSLLVQIDALQRSVPEARHTQSVTSARNTESRTSAAKPALPSPPAPAPVARGPAFQPESAGIVTLATELTKMASARRQLASVLQQTDALTQSIDARRAPLGGGIRELVRLTDSTSGSSADPAHTASSQRDLQSAVVRVRELTTALVPLGEQGVAVDSARSTLVESRTDLTAAAAVTARYLLIRILVLALAIGIVLFISEIWRRATFRYLRDVRRRRQFLLLRRIVVVAAVTIVLVVGFVSQLGSLATYAGFVTAGVAVALQNVILAVVAYFFLIGRYGVRVGDRITIGGVTGSVIEIGLVRIYLMELQSPDWRPTGRIVVFSNAVLFQPSALFKQMPGVDYGWHTITLMLAPDADLSAAEHDLRAAVDAAYEEFRESIERQHAKLQESVNVQTPEPGPELQLRFADEGVVMTIRYPVERARTTEMDNRLMTAIRQALSKPPGIPLAAGGSPKLQDALVSPGA